MSDSMDVSRAAGDRFGSAMGFSLGDAEQRRIRYHLLRLTVAGLTRQDVTDLGELARLAFQDSDVTQQATMIKERADASPLAFAIADIVERSPNRGSSSRPAMLGAVLGAYAAFGDGDRQDAAISGAVAGAVAACTSNFIVEQVDRMAWSDYVDMSE
jgi:hypothetical protein